VNAKLFACIAMGVFVAHLAVFMIYMRVTFRPEATVPAPKPTFKVAEEVIPIRGGGGKIVNREFTVSTRLAPPGTYKGPAGKPVNE